MLHHSEYFCGNKISNYGLENGYVDYGTLAKAFDAVLNNDIMAATENAGLGCWEQESGQADYSDEIDELQEQIDELQEQIDEWTEKQDDVGERFPMFPGLYDYAEDQIDKLQNEIDKLEEQIDDLQHEMDYSPEVFQWYIVSDPGARLLKECNEIVYYNEEIDMYLWGVTHYGTSWDYVLTNIKIEMED